ncbi:MAG TPA: amidohydrolase family protein [Candidatus Acidoferrales bacterium]|nr:amidohydrolase family protein [Candidatus Acidoferrales bacterium]
MIWLTQKVTPPSLYFHTFRLYLIKNIGCHKGIPFAQFMARYTHPGDFDAVADDFPDLNFIAYHAAWPYHAELTALKSFKPHRKNLFCELGTTFAATVTSRPLECAHILGTLLRDFGEDYVLWGTDSPLWGSPQWQIEAFRRFQIPDPLVKGHGYPRLTASVKRKVLGENAARLWGIKRA